MVGRALEKLLSAVEDSHERCESSQLTLPQASYLSLDGLHPFSLISARPFKVRVYLSAAFGMESAHVHVIFVDSRDQAGCIDIKSRI